jgi:hypothetical protein
MRNKKQNRKQNWKQKKKAPRNPTITTILHYLPNKKDVAAI